VSDWTPLAVVGLAAVAAFVVACLERAFAGRSPSPLAVVRDGAAALAQPLRRPSAYDHTLFHLAPGLLVLAAIAALAMVPWAPGFRGVDLQTGGILFTAALAYVTPAVFMAGWGAGRPLSVVGGFRFLGAMLWFAMPLAMVVTSVAAPAESLRPTDIVAVQHAVPMVVVQPLAFVLWMPATLAVCFLPPFDFPQARGELGGGAFAGYRGLDAALVRLAQRLLLVALAGMTVVLFFSGWQGPVLPPAVWMGLKTTVVVVALLWVGRRLPRIEIDRAVSWAWKFAIPGAILAIVWAGLVTLLFYR
jgi:NADH-quinone oxidoreductase subunit H